MRGALLALRFLLELCALAALAYWGATVDASTVVRVILAVVTPLLAAVVWGTWVAPRAPRLLDDPIRLIPEFAVFGGAVLRCSAPTGRSLPRSSPYSRSAIGSAWRCCRLSPLAKVLVAVRVAAEELGETSRLVPG